jgi:5-methylcytosine-specific restriction endonuclease McrA
VRKQGCRGSTSTAERVDCPAHAAREGRSAFVSAKHRRAYPLAQLPADMRTDIARAVAAETPPEKWKLIGAKDSPRPLAAIPSRAYYEWYWQRGRRAPDEKREKTPRDLREHVIARDGHICGICGRPVAPDNVHIDHIKPLCRGGVTVLGNLRVTHSKCNLRKGGR